MTDQHRSRLIWAAACARRLERHGLAATTFQRPEQAVAAMCGAHAQILSAAELSVGLRLGAGTRADVRDAARPAGGAGRGGTGGDPHA
jgi:hypothetical protein